MPSSPVSSLSSPLVLSLVLALAVAASVLAVRSAWLRQGLRQWRETRSPQKEEDVVTLLRRGAFVSQLHAQTPAEAIAELVRALGSLLKGRKRVARDAVLERELLAATGLGDEVAIPHAALEGLEQALLALGRAPEGIDFGAHDGRPARLVFLLLIPPGANVEEVHILASIARATIAQAARDAIVAAADLEEVTRVLAESANVTRKSLRP
jgi:mannitol/fructose-specific phosphotransferase system IIA component (Ntr-type)